MIGEEGSCISEKPSLLKKYDLTVDNLSYEYVEKCKDVKALERIIKILRSGEEGNFPDLLSFAENQLKDICPSNRLLVKPEPVQPLSSLSTNDRNKISYEMESWSEEMKKHDSLLKEAETKESLDIPPIRSCDKNISLKKPSIVKKKTSIKSLDYEAWDKYDPDQEIMKMEIEEEREREEQSRLMEKKHSENKPDKPMELGNFSETEKHAFSIQEKDRGNECFRAGQYEEATRHYTKSISYLPNVAAYNNRAMANLKLEKYGEVILDCDEVLKLDAKNVKALFRRGYARESNGLYSKAMKDFEHVLEVDPTNNLAKSHVSHLKKKLKETSKGKPKKARMVVEDMDSFEEELKSIQIFDKKIQPDICSKPSFPHWRGSYSCDPMSSGDRKLNEWGYPRVVCNCTSIPRALQKKHIPHPKDPGKGSIQLPSKYSSIQGGKGLPKYENAERKSGELREGDTNERTSLSDSSSCQAVQPLRDMPFIASDKEPVPSILVSGQLSEGAEVESPAADVEMQSPNDQPMEISKDDDGFKELDMESATSPYNFIKIWNQINVDENFSKRATLLKRISPSNLSAVIGKKLDGFMLSTIIACLNSHFADDEKLLLDYLIGISELPRFSAVILFLTAQEKNVVKGLFQKLEESGKLVIPDGLRASYEL